MDMRSLGMMIIHEHSLTGTLVEKNQPESNPFRTPH